MIFPTLMETPRATTPPTVGEPRVAALPADDGRPVRIVARQLGELMQASAQRWMAALRVDRLDGLIVTVVLSANIAHVRDGDAMIALPDDRRRPISPMAVADSMQLPYETVRRRVKAMCAAGLLIVRDNGVIVSAAATASPISAVMSQDAAALRTSVATLAAQGHEASANAKLDVSDAALSRAMLDLAVRMMQRFVARYGGLVAGSIFTAIIAANVRHLLSDAVLARRYATARQVPPDSERRPVAIRTIARELDIPFETARRQVGGLVARGVVVLGPGGAVVPTHVIASPEHTALNQFNLAQFERLLADLSRD